MEQLGIAALGALGGAVGHWFIINVVAWIRSPNPKIEFDEGYPFRSEAKFGDGKGGIFLNVRVKNRGWETARKCKVFVRRIRLYPGSNEEKVIPSEFLMQTRWVPREADIWEIDIPRDIEFHANIAFIKENEQYNIPAFRALNSVSEPFSPHIGEFKVEIVLAGDNFIPVTNEIRFRRPEGSPDLIPLPRK